MQDKGKKQEKKIRRKGKAQITAYTLLGYAKLARELLDFAVHEEGTKLFRDGLGNSQSGGRKIKIIIIVEDEPVAKNHA